MVVVDAVCTMLVTAVLSDAAIFHPVGAVTGNVITIVLVPVVVAVTNPALLLLPVPMVAPVQVVAVPVATNIDLTVLPLINVKVLSRPFVKGSPELNPYIPLEAKFRPPLEELKVPKHAPPTTNETLLLPPIIPVFVVKENPIDGAASVP